MKPSLEQLENLLTLRRDERPEEGYWQDFLCEFHDRQRQQAMAQSGIKAFIGRRAAWFAEMGSSKWTYAAGLAYATATVAFFLPPRNEEFESAPASPVNYQVIPSPAPTVKTLEPSPSAQGTAAKPVRVWPRRGGDGP